MLDESKICPECGTPHVDQEGGIIRIKRKQVNSYFENNEREHLIVSFNGKATWGNKVFEGKLHITNLRIAGFGLTKEAKSKGSGGLSLAAQFSDLVAFAEIVMGGTLDDKRDLHSVEDLIEYELVKTFSRELLQMFDCNLPIIKAFNIERTSALSYSIPLNPQYELGLPEIRFMITPKKDKKEKSKEFNRRRSMIFDLMEKNLLKTHELTKYEINYESRYKPSDLEYYLYEFLINNQGSAFTPDAIWKRKEQLGLPQEFNETSPEQIGNGLDKLYSRGDALRRYREGKYFYYS